MTVIGNVCKLVFAGGLLAATVSPSFAAWVVVQMGGQCEIMEESAATGEIRLAGPYESQEEAEKAKSDHAECSIEKSQ